MNTNNFNCRNCGYNHGVLVMTGNDKPAIECQGCGYLEISVALTVKASDLREAYKITPSGVKLIQPQFRSGQIVTCIETYANKIFSGYNYMVTSYDPDSGLLSLKNLRTMEPIPAAFSETRFQAAPQYLIDELIEIGRAKGWTWIEELDEEIQRLASNTISVPVKPEPQRALTMADLAYWRNYNKAFGSKNPGPSLRPKTQPPGRKFPFIPTNPFNIKPWGKSDVS